MIYYVAILLGFTTLFLLAICLAKHLEQSKVLNALIFMFWNLFLFVSIVFCIQGVKNVKINPYTPCMLSLLLLMAYMYLYTSSKTKDAYMVKAIIDAKESDSEQMDYIEFHDAYVAINKNIRLIHNSIFADKTKFSASLRGYQSYDFLTNYVEQSDKIPDMLLVTNCGDKATLSFVTQFARCGEKLTSDILDEMYDDKSDIQYIALCLDKLAGMLSFLDITIMTGYCPERADEVKEMLQR